MLSGQKAFKTQLYRDNSAHQVPSLEESKIDTLHRICSENDKIQESLAKAKDDACVSEAAS